MLSQMSVIEIKRENLKNIKNQTKLDTPVSTNALTGPNEKTIKAFLTDLNVIVSEFCIIFPQENFF